jgi:hypothetical protein
LCNVEREWRRVPTATWRSRVFTQPRPKLDITSQGKTVEEATANLKEAVELFLETADPAEIKQRLHDRILVTTFEAAHG